MSPATSSNGAPTLAAPAPHLHEAEFSLVTAHELHMLRELATFRDSPEVRGTLLGVSSISALLLYEMVERLHRVGDHLGKMSMPYGRPDAAQAVAPAGAGAPSAAPQAQPAPVAAAPAQTAAEPTRLLASTAIEKASTDAIGQAVAAALAESVQKPFADVLARISDLGASLAQLQAGQGAQQARIDGLQATTQTLTQQTSALQLGQNSAAQRLDSLHARLEGAVRRSGELSEIVAGMGVELDVVEAATVALEQEVEAVERPTGDDKPARPAAPTRKSSRKSK